MFSELGIGIRFYFYYLKVVGVQESKHYFLSKFNYKIMKIRTDSPTQAPTKVEIGLKRDLNQLAQDNSSLLRNKSEKSRDKGHSNCGKKRLRKKTLGRRAHIQ